MNVGLINTRALPDRQSFRELFDRHGAAPPVYCEPEDVPFDPVTLFERIRTRVRYPFLHDSAD